MKIRTSAKTVKDTFYVYTVSEPDGPILFVGLDLLSNLVRFRELMKNPEFDPFKTYEIELRESAPNPFEGRRAQYRLLNELFGCNTPPLNRSQNLSHHMSVLCEQTGIIYRSAAEACDNLNLSQSQLSQHLAGKRGYKSVKGYTFRYVPPTLPTAPAVPQQ